MDQQIDNQKFKQIKAGPYNKFVAAKRFKKFENAKVVVDKSKNKAIVTTFHTEKEDVKEKRERHVVLNLKEILLLPDYVKNQNLYDKISAKFYQNHGIVVTLPVNQKRMEKLAEKSNNQQGE